MKATETLLRNNVERNEAQENFKDIVSISQALEEGIICLNVPEKIKSIRVITGKYGESAIVDIDNEKNIRLPRYTVPMMKAIDGFVLNHDVPLDDVLHIVFYSYHNENYDNKLCYGVSFRN